MNESKFYYDVKNNNVIVFCLSSYVRTKLLIYIIDNIEENYIKIGDINNLFNRLLFVKYGGLEQDITIDELGTLTTLTQAPFIIHFGKKIFDTEINDRKNLIITRNTPISPFYNLFV